MLGTGSKLLFIIAYLGIKTQLNVSSVIKTIFVPTYTTLGDELRQDRSAGHPHAHQEHGTHTPLRMSMSDGGPRAIPCGFHSTSIQVSISANQRGSTTAADLKG